MGHVEESENINQITIVMNLESFSLKLKEMEILLSVGRIDTKIIL